MHGSTDGYDRDVTICAWNNGWYGLADAHRDGFNFINAFDAELYLVPYADYYHGAGLDHRRIHQ